MFAHVFLFRELVKRDFQSRYAGSLLGFLWSFVGSVWQLALFTFVFATVLRIPLTGERTDSFAIFLFCGLIPWMAVHEGIVGSSTAITNNAELVKKVSFPAEVLVVVAVAGGLIQQGIALGVFAIVLAVAGKLGLGLPLLLVALPLQIALTLGLGFLTCSANTFFRDTAQVLGMLLMGWFYLTPIVYSLQHVPERYRGWIELNPLTTLVSLYRQAFLGGEIAWVAGTGYLAAFSLALATLGFAIFRHLKPTFADVI